MGYQDVYNKIVNTLMGRPNGEEILPEKHQDYALSLLNYVREIESATTSSLVGVAETHTIPIQPNSYICYITGISKNNTAVYSNFLKEDGTPISITTNDSAKIGVLLWNRMFWSIQTFSTDIINSGQYNFNVRKTYSSVAQMDLDVDSPIATDGLPIEIGEIVTVVNNSTTSENGYYSYEGASWAFQFGFTVEIENVRSQNPSKAPSSKLLDDYQL